MGCPITLFDLIVNGYESDYLEVDLILTKNGNVPSSCAIMDFTVALEQAAYGRELYLKSCDHAGTVPKCADPGTMASNLSVPLLSAET